jgi:hypothetical protein
MLLVAAVDPPDYGGPVPVLVERDLVQVLDLPLA